MDTIRPVPPVGGQLIFRLYPGTETIPHDRKAGEIATVLEVSRTLVKVAVDGVPLSGRWNLEWFEPYAPPVLLTSLPETTTEETTMTETTHPRFNVGDRVTVTDTRTSISNHPLGSGQSPYVGKSGTVVDVPHNASTTDRSTYSVRIDGEDHNSSWTHPALDPEGYTPGQVMGDALVADALQTDLDHQKQRVVDLEAERTTLTQAASDERRRLTAEIDEKQGSLDVCRAAIAAQQATIDDLYTRIADLVKEKTDVELLNHSAEATLEYAERFLDVERAAMVRGFKDGFAAAERYED